MYCNMNELIWSIIDTSLNLELFKNEHLPELFDKYFRHIVQNALYFLQQAVRGALPCLQQFHNQLYHAWFLDPQIFLNLFGDPRSRYPLYHLKFLHGIPINCKGKYVLLFFWQTGDQSLGQRLLLFLTGLPDSHFFLMLTQHGGCRHLSASIRFGIIFDLFLLLLLE